MSASTSWMPQPISDTNMFPGMGSGSNQWMGGWPMLPGAGGGGGGAMGGAGLPMPMTTPPAPTGGGAGIGFDPTQNGLGGAGTGMKSSTPPGVVPPSSSAIPGGGTNPFTGPPNGPGMTGIGKGNFAENPIDPALTSSFFNWLQSQIGQGMKPFNLSALMPSSGKATDPGQLSAPLTQLLQQMQAMFMPGTQLGDLASKGIDATPMWQKTVDAMQRQIGQGATNLKEQFNVGGNLVGSPYGNAAADYQMQSNKDLNAMLAQMQFQGLQDQMQAAGMEGSLGQMMQGLDQSSIDRMLQEFIRTSPENNPLLSLMFGASTTFPPVIQPKTGAGGLGALLGASGGILDGLGGLKNLFGGDKNSSSGLGGLGALFGL